MKNLLNGLCSVYSSYQESYAAPAPVQPSPGYNSSGYGYGYSTGGQGNYENDGYR